MDKRPSSTTFDNISPFYLAKPGVDYFDFGGQDLGHDLAIQQHPGFETVAACKDFVTHAPQGTGVSFGLAGRAGQRL